MKAYVDDSGEKHYTGTECQETGSYMCHLHPSVVKTVYKGKLFPRCTSGAGHATYWQKLLYE